MTTILQDLSESALVKAIENNRYALTPYSYNWPGADVYSNAGVMWCITDIAFPACNAAFKARLQPEQVDTAIENFIAQGRARKVPLQWWTGHDTYPANLGEILIAHGFTHSGNSAGMAIDLEAMNENVPSPPGLTIKRVEDIDTLKTWAHVASVGFGIQASKEPALLRWFATCLELKLPMQFYLGWWNGNPVASSMLLSAEGVAGLYFVATLPEARCHGIGYAITQKPLLEAREMGYRVGILQASKMGYPVYLNMGFKEYCKIGVYMWTYKSQSNETR